MRNNRRCLKRVTASAPPPKLRPSRVFTSTITTVAPSRATISISPYFVRYRRARIVYPRRFNSAHARSSPILPRACAADWIYAPDAAAGIVGVLEADQIDQHVFDLGGGRVTDAMMWCEAIAAHFPQFRWRIVEQGDEPNIAYRLPYDRAPLDNTAIVAATGFEPRFDLPRAAVDYLEWCRIALA